MRTIHLTELLLIAVLPISAAPSPDLHGAELDELLASYGSPGAPGVAILVQSGGGECTLRCTGLADIEQGTAITPQTLFDFASVSKHLTAYGVLLMAADGALSLDDPVRRYIPELPACADPVRIRHLIHQSSGLWEFWTILNRYSGFLQRDYIRMDDVLTLLAGQPALNFEPGSRYAYTNTNYSLLSLVVERASGVAFDTWMRDHIFAPLGMRSTLIQTDCTRPIPQRAHGYLRDGEGWRLARPSNVEVPGSAHAFTNLDDMARWLANLRDRRLGGEELFMRLTTPGVLNDGTPMSYAAGLIVRSRHGVKTIYHSGQTGGFKTMLIYCPEEELGIVVLANARGINAVGLGFEILDLCLGFTSEEPAAPTTEAATAPQPGRELLDRYAGGYRLQPDGELIGVYRNGDHLVAAIRGLGGDHFTPRSETTFTDYSGSAVVTFQRNPAGDVIALSLTLDGATQRAVRVQDEAFPREAEGHYCCLALGSHCQIASEGSRAILKHRRYGAIPLEGAGPGVFFCEWGFLELERDGDEAVAGFRLSDELFAWRPLRFARVD